MDTPCRCSDAGLPSTVYLPFCIRHERQSRRPSGVSPDLLCNPVHPTTIHQLDARDGSGIGTARHYQAVRPPPDPPDPRPRRLHLELASTGFATWMGHSLNRGGLFVVPHPELGAVWG